MISIIECCQAASILMNVLVLVELIIVCFLQRTMRDDVSFRGLAPFPSGNARSPIRQVPSSGRFKARPSFITLCVSWLEAGPEKAGAGTLVLLVVLFMMVSNGEKKTMWSPVLHRFVGEIRPYLNKNRAALTARQAFPHVRDFSVYFSVCLQIH